MGDHLPRNMRPWQDNPEPPEPPDGPPDPIPCHQCGADLPDVPETVDWDEEHQVHLEERHCSACGALNRHME